MGGFQTKECGSPMLYQDCTPPREPGFTKRQLPVDPRSPTDDIVRTPIIVDNEPSGLQGLDPRSPTYGIERTPLAVLFGKATDQQITMDVKTKPQPHPSVDSAPLCQPEDTKDVDMTTPQKPSSSSDLDLVEDLIPDIDAEDASPLLENPEQQPQALAEPTPMQPKVMSQPKKLFPMTQPASAALKPSLVARSPLGLVARDANSPRSIVQTKQRRQIIKSMGGIRNQVGGDKENMAH